MDEKPTLSLSALEMIQNPSEVLLVEDNAGDALLIGQALSEYPRPVHLRIARDGEQALQILEEPGFTADLVILDLNIPRISGHAVLASYQLHATPVVVFSAYHNEAQRDRVLSLGAKDFVHKPLDLDDFKNAVTRMVQKWVVGLGATVVTYSAARAHVQNILQWLRGDDESQWEEQIGLLSDTVAVLREMTGPTPPKSGAQKPHLIPPRAAGVNDAMPYLLGMLAAMDRHNSKEALKYGIAAWALLPKG
jgi:chemotaxis family two-component system response regulator Rcp1